MGQPVRATRCRLRGMLGLLVAALAGFAAPRGASAHNLDEYLQATIVAIEPDVTRLKVNLTPGVEIAETVVSRIDRDRDDAISTEEAAAYAEALRRDLAVKLDGRDVGLTLAASEFPRPSDLRTGWGMIRLEFSASTGPLAAGAHRLSFENWHLPLVSAYLLNAAQPTSRSLRITRQTREYSQRTGEVEFGIESDVDPSRKRPATVGVVAPSAALLAAVFVGAWRRRAPRGPSS